MTSYAMRRLAGRGYVVTGAASGIGRAVATRIAAEGGGVVLADIDEAGLRDTASAIEEDGGRCAPLPADVTDPVFPDRAVALAQSELGRIDAPACRAPT